MFTAKRKLESGNQKVQNDRQVAILKMMSLKIKLESRNRKKQYGRQAAILKMTTLKINSLSPIYVSIVPLKFGVDIQSQTEVRVRKPKNAIWPPGRHFESDNAENQ